MVVIFTNNPATSRIYFLRATRTGTCIVMGIRENCSDAGGVAVVPVAEDRERRFATTITRSRADPTIETKEKIRSMINPDAWPRDYYLIR
jgi:hypothetical protein